MPVKSVRFYTIAFVIADMLAVLSAFTIAYILRVQIDSRPLVTQIYARDFIEPFFILLPFWLLTFWSFGLYSPHVYLKRLTEYHKLFAASAVGILIVIGYAYMIDVPIFPARLVPIYAGILVFMLLVLFRELLRALRDMLYRFDVGVQRVLIIGNNKATADIARSLSVTRKSGYCVAAIAGYADQSTDATIYQSAEEALEDLDALRIDSIIQTSLYDSSRRNQAIMTAALEHHIQYSFIPGESEFYSGKNHIDVFLGYPMINVYQTPLIGWGEVVKRVFDIVTVLITLPLWGALILLVILLQLIFNPGPPFYRSQRLTKHSRAFGIFKFRSMGAQYGKRSAIEDFKAMGRDDLIAEYERDFKVENDPRITPFGNFLRKSSLDELPQIINVLLGDISLVGPRPIPTSELKAKFSSKRAALLHEVRAGITGLWQVSGRNDLTTEQRIELELYYVQNWSFWLDIKILFKTVLVVLRRSGAR